MQAPSYAGLTGHELVNMPVETIFDQISSKLTQNNLSFERNIANILHKKRQADESSYTYQDSVYQAG